MISALKTIPQIAEYVTNAEAIFGDTFTFGVAVAGKGEMAIFGSSLKDLYDRLGVAEKVGMVMGKAEDLVNKAADIAGIDAESADSLLTKATDFVDKIATKLSEIIAKIKTFVDGIEAKVTAVVTEKMAQLKTFAFDALSSAISAAKAKATNSAATALAKADIEPIMEKMLAVESKIAELMSATSDGADGEVSKATEVLQTLRSAAAKLETFVRTVPAQFLNKEPLDGKIGTDKLAEMLSKVDEVKAQIQTVADRAKTVWNTAKAIAQEAIDSAEAGVVASTATDGSVLVETVSAVFDTLEAKLTQAYEDVEQKAKDFIALVKAKKQLAYDTVDKYMGPIQPACAKVREWLDLLAQTGDIGQVVMEILSSEIYKKIDKQIRKLWFMKDSIADVWKGFAPADAAAICPPETAFDAENTNAATAAIAAL